MTLATDLQERAVEYARTGNFGPDALQINRELTRMAPDNEAAWTRLARCGMESGQLDEATAALDAVLNVNPQNTIARSLQVEVSKRRANAAAALAAVKLPKTKSGKASVSKARTARSAKSVGPTAAFGTEAFVVLNQLPAAAMADTLGPRMEALVMALNELPFAEKAVEARNRAGRPGARLFRRDSFHASSDGELEAFHYGGRWEPRLSVALTGASHSSGRGRDSLGAGVLFDLAPDETNQAGHTRALEFFGSLQRLLTEQWRTFLSDWLTARGGTIEIDRATDAVPAVAAVDALAAVGHPDALRSVFIGRRLYPDRAEDAAILADARQLIAWIDQTFDGLMPLWSSVYRART